MKKPYNCTFSLERTIILEDKNSLLVPLKSLESCLSQFESESKKSLIENVFVGLTITSFPPFVVVNLLS